MQRLILRLLFYSTVRPSFIFSIALHHTKSQVLVITPLITAMFFGVLISQ